MKQLIISAASQVLSWNLHKERFISQWYFCEEPRLFWKQSVLLVILYFLEKCSCPYSGTSHFGCQTVSRKWFVQDMVPYSFKCRLLFTYIRIYSMWVSEVTSFGFVFILLWTALLWFETMSSSLSIYTLLTIAIIHSWIQFFLLFKYYIFLFPWKKIPLLL